jgi:hypothetical protein
VGQHRGRHTLSAGKITKSDIGATGRRRAVGRVAACARLS